MNGNAQEENEQEPVIEVLVDPPLEVIRQSTIAPGMGILYRYHPDTDQRLAEGFPRFIEGGQGRLVVARSGKNIVGYAVITRPDSQERWGGPSVPELWELGFIEVARGRRQRGIGRELLRACFADGALDDRIVLATAYVWHWDLEGTGLSKEAYQDVLVRTFRSIGFEPLETDEPNIQEDPANRLFVRIGPRVNPKVREEFLALLHPAGETAVAASRSGIAPAWTSLADLVAHSVRMWDPNGWLVPWTETWRVAASRIPGSFERWAASFRLPKSAGAPRGSKAR
jgi:acetoin utilization protein AcuA